MSHEESASAETADRLDGWKRIAAHLGRDVRTVRRWEKGQGLPMHRLMHDKKATVYAYRSELDAWLQRQDGDTPNQASPQRAKRGYWPWAVAAKTVMRARKCRCFTMWGLRQPHRQPFHEIACSNDMLPSLSHWIH